MSTLVPSQRYVTKSHELVTAKTDDMTLKEAQLLTLAISMIDSTSDDHTGMRVVIDRRAFDALFGMNGMSGGTLKRLSDLLQTRTVTVMSRHSEIHDVVTDPKTTAKEDQQLKKLMILSSADYSGGKFTIAFNHKLKLHLTGMRERNITYCLENIIGLRSPYQFRLYEILLMHLDTKEFRIEIPRFRDMLGVVDKYFAYSDLRKRVLDPSVHSINKRTDLDVKYHAERKGTEVTAIVFFINQKLGFYESNSSSILCNEGVKVSFLVEAGPQIGAATNVAKIHEGSIEELAGNIRSGTPYFEGLRNRGNQINEAGVNYKAIKENCISQEDEPKSNKDNTSINIRINTENPSVDEHEERDKMSDIIELHNEVAGGIGRFIENKKGVYSIKLIQKYVSNGSGLRKVVLEYGRTIPKKAS